MRKAEKLYILQGRYRIEANSVNAGNLVLIEGIDQAVVKTSTIVDAQNNEDIDIMIPLKFWTEPIIKVSI